MSIDAKIHGAQTNILRELLFVPQAGYAELQKPTGLTSDHFNFHISKLVTLKLVEKVSRGRYRLTPKGKEYANKLDTDDHTIERQPKTSVILAIERKNKAGATEFVFQERLKHPYFGFWSLPSGKIRWGETIVQTAARESMEETGLVADWQVVGVYHEMVELAETGELTEDKLFFVVHGVNPHGKLKTAFDGGRSEWMSTENAYAKPKKFDSFKIELDMITSKEWLVERLTSYTKEHF